MFKRCFLICAVVICLLLVSSKEISAQYFGSMRSGRLFNFHLGLGIGQPAPYYGDNWGGYHPYYPYYSPRYFHGGRSPFWNFPRFRGNHHSGHWGR